MGLNLCLVLLERIPFGQLWSIDHDGLNILSSSPGKKKYSVWFSVLNGHQNEEWQCCAHLYVTFALLHASPNNSRRGHTEILRLLQVL